MGQGESRLTSERQKVLSSREAVIDAGNGIVDALNRNKAFASDFCERLKAISAAELIGFRKQDIDGVAVLVGLEPSQTSASQKEKRDLCLRIVSFFELKLKMLNEASSQMGYCERLEEDLFRNIEPLKVCNPETRPVGQNCMKGAMCSAGGTWVCLDSNPNWNGKLGFTEQSDRDLAIQRLVQLNTNINSTYRRIKRAINNLRDSRNLKELEVARKSLVTALADQKSKCTLTSSLMSIHHTPGFDRDEKPKGYISQRYWTATRNSTGSGGNTLEFLQGDVIEMLTLPDTNDVFLAKKDGNTGYVTMADFA